MFVRHINKKRIQKFTVSHISVRSRCRKCLRCTIYVLHIENYFCTYRKLTKTLVTVAVNMVSCLFTLLEYSSVMGFL